MSTMSSRDFRPRLHFSPSQMWLNDPNGLVYTQGEYHLFYQYYPGDTVWGPMHWGHARSRDLCDWEELPIALYPDSSGQIFSGCAVIDRENVSGLGAFGQAPLIAFFTHHREYGQSRTEEQSLAYSLDGIHFEKYAGNPVIAGPQDKDFRDPKVLLLPDGRTWCMVIAAGDRVLFYHAADLKQWEMVGSFGPVSGLEGLWECPDLFALEAPDGTKKWVLLISLERKVEQGGPGVWYFIGDFDGRIFTPDQAYAMPAPMNGGYDEYAGVSFFGAPERTYLAWQSNWRYAGMLPTGPYSGIMGLPRTLRLVQTQTGGLRLGKCPANLAGRIQRVRDLSRPYVCTDSDWSVEVRAAPAVFCLPGETFGLRIAGQGPCEVVLENLAGQRLRLGVDEKNQVWLDRSQAGQKHFSEVFASKRFSVCSAQRYFQGPYTLELVFDVSAVDLFADQGTVDLSALVFPDLPYTKVSFSGDVRLEHFSFACPGESRRPMP